MFKHLKPGDKVFVVYQLRRGQTEGDRRMLYKILERKGRTYGYIGAGHTESRFALKNGYSVHDGGDYNARANGHGFNVYLSKKDYEIEVHNRNEFNRLRDRMVDRMRGLKPFPPEVVNAIHSILDNQIKGKKDE